MKSSSVALYIHLTSYKRSKMFNELLISNYAGSIDFRQNNWAKCLQIRLKPNYEKNVLPTKKLHGMQNLISLPVIFIAFLSTNYYSIQKKRRLNINYFMEISICWLKLDLNFVFSQYTDYNKTFLILICYHDNTVHHLKRVFIFSKMNKKIQSYTNSIFVLF